MLRRYPYHDAGIVAALVFGLGGLLLGVVTGSVAPGVSPLLVAPITALVGGAVAYMTFASASDRRPTILWQGAVADGIIAGITSAIVVALVVALVGGRAGTSTGPATATVARDVGIAITAGLVAGVLLGLLTLAFAGTARMSRLPPVRHGSRRRKRAARKRR